MKVSELIKRLKNFDSKAEVVIGQIIGTNPMINKNIVLRQTPKGISIADPTFFEVVDEMFGDEDDPDDGKFNCPLCEKRKARGKFMPFDKEGHQVKVCSTCAKKVNRNIENYFDEDGNLLKNKLAA